MLFQNASVVWPESVRPLASVIVPEIQTGHRRSCSSKRVSSAKIAALALRVSKIVSTRSRSAPPSTRPRASSRYDATSSSKPVLRAPGSLTSGEIEAVLLVGPSEPATYRGHSGVDALVGGRAGQGRRGPVELVAVVLEAVVGLGDAGGGERVGADDVGAGREVLAVDVTDDVGLGQREDVGVALEVVVVAGERLAAVVVLAELVALDQGAHRAVDHEDPLAEGGGQLLGRVGTLRGCGHGSPLGFPCGDEVGIQPRQGVRNVDTLPGC